MTIKNHGIFIYVVYIGDNFDGDIIIMKNNFLKKIKIIVLTIVYYHVLFWNNILILERGTY